MMPKHLEHITFWKPNHFQRQPRGRNKWSLTKDFAFDAMRELGVEAIDSSAKLVALSGNQIGVLIKVVLQYTEKKGEQTCLRRATGYGSKNSAARGEGEESYAAQTAYTFAVKAAIEWLLGISNQDVDDVADALKMGSRVKYETEEVEPAEPEKEEMSDDSSLEGDLFE
jgi:hypothetical protein